MPKAFELVNGTYPYKNNTTIRDRFYGFFDHTLLSLDIAVSAGTVYPICILCVVMSSEIGSKNQRVWPLIRFCIKEQDRGRHHRFCQVSTHAMFSSICFQIPSACCLLYCSYLDGTQISSSQQVCLWPQYALPLRV